MEEDIILDLLESRVKALESKIYNKSIEELNMNKVKPILKALHEVDTVLISTISGRDKIMSLFNKVDVIEKLLDPMFLEPSYNLDFKIESILESEKDILNFDVQLNKLKELEPILSCDTFKNLSSFKDRLNVLNNNVLKNKELCDAQTADVTRLVKEFNEAIFYLSNLFVELDILITNIEIKNKSNE